MKNKIAVVLAVTLAGLAFNANAISAGYRAQLERSGCTQVTDGHGCDIHKTKAQNQKAGGGKTSLRAVSAYTESMIGADIGNAADALLADGWKANQGDWFKGGHQIRLVVEAGKVVNAQVLK